MLRGSSNFSVVVSLNPSNVFFFLFSGKEEVTHKSIRRWWEIYLVPPKGGVRGTGGRGSRKGLYRVGVSIKLLIFGNVGNV